MAEKQSQWEDPVLLRHTLILGLHDKSLSEQIIQQMKCFNYTCISCDTLENLLQIVQDRTTTENFGAIILDTDYCTAKDPTLLKTLSEKIPLIFISKYSDVATRLFAIKAGGQAYFVPPLEFTSFIEKIDQLVTPTSESPPFRILISEDSLTQAHYIQRQLTQAGMITEILPDPLQINEVLVEFQPDLILLDLYMPICTGIELAKVIRQQDPFMSIPIVYLSVEHDIDKQLFAMREGGDDFLIKSIIPEHLIVTISTRAQRARTLRAGMSQDSLTGLLNHTRILEQLELEIARAKRNNTPLSFAMIDLDNFKAVNDTYGHLVGDRVIKSLARLLKQRLRKIDSVGRYGGEEFAVILPQTTLKGVHKILNQIREGFSVFYHLTNEPVAEFAITFSAGLAQLTNELDTVDKIVEAADSALYLAKEQGRNRIIFPG